jgi:dTMP kinase
MSGDDRDASVLAPLIAIEGIDGAGTTTLARHLVDRLAAAGIAGHLTREPSDGPVGALLRRILAGEHAPVDATTLSLLFAADRADHLQREVEPQLRAGAVVVSDRWYHSSLAYQGTGEERAWILALNARARRPDLTIFLQVDPEVAAGRRAADGRAEEIFDRLATQRQVAAGYLAVIEMLRERERIEILDGEQPADQVAEAAWRLVRETCAAHGRRPRS